MPETPSLNDCLISVPPKINDLTGIISRFRLHRFAVSTDIEKAFLQILIDEDDRDVTRLIWLSDPTDQESPLTTYRFEVVLFGTTMEQCSEIDTVVQVLGIPWNVENDKPSFQNNIIYDT